MFRSPADAKPVTLNFAMDNGGLGDQIAKTPVINYILKNYLNVSLNLWAPKYMIELLDYWYKGNPRITINLMDNVRNADNTLAALTSKSKHHTSLKTHIVSVMFHVMLDIEEPIGPDMEYSRIKVEPNGRKPYIVICPNYTANSRQMLPEAITEMAIWAKSKGLDVVFLGKSETYSTSFITITGISPPADYSSLGENLLDKTTLLEAAQLLGNAKAVVGLDSGLLHLAACTNVPIVAAFTTVNPDHRAPFRDGIKGKNFYPVVPDTSLGCRFCQSNMQFIYEHSFKECYYGDFLCTKQLTANKYIDRLSAIV